MAELVHRDADLAAARAARATGVPMTISNQASFPMERIAEELGDHPRIFQLYWSTENDLVESFAHRAEAIGADAIAVTLDTTLLGWRTKDLDIASLPFLRGQGIAQYTSDPVFRRIAETIGAEERTEQQPGPSPAAVRTLLAMGRNHPDGTLDALRSGAARSAVQAFVRHLLAAVADLGGPAVPAPAHEAADRPQGDPPSRRRAPRGRGGHRRHLGLQPRRAPGRRRDLDDRGAARDRRGGRRPRADRARLGRALGGGRLQGARARGHGGRRSAARGPTASGSPARRAPRRCSTNLRADFDLTLGLAGCASIDEIGPESLRA